MGKNQFVYTLTNDKDQILSTFTSKAKLVEALDVWTKNTGITWSFPLQKNPKKFEGTLTAIWLETENEIVHLYANRELLNNGAGIIQALHQFESYHESRKAA